MTLIEILVAGMILSILGTFAAVTYVRVYEKNRGETAIATVRMIHAAERIYYMDWNTYATLGGCTSNLITQGYMQCPNIGNLIKVRGFFYSVTMSAPPTASVLATRWGFGGRYHSKTIILEVKTPGSSPPFKWGGTWPAEWIPPN